MQEGFNDTKFQLYEIQNRIDSQQEDLALIIQSNKIIINSISNIDKKLDELLEFNSNPILLSETENSISSKLEQKKDNNTFNILDKTVIVDGKTYSYNREVVICGSESLTKALKNVTQEKYLLPQGLDDCKKLINKEIKKGEDGKLIIFIFDPSNYYFFFPLKNYDDLMYTQSRYYRYNDHIKKKNYIYTDFHVLYKDDQYPQGISYVSSLINDFMNNKNHLLIIMRENKDKTWTRYYFKSKEVAPILENKNVEIIQEDKLKNELKKIQNNAVFPQGFQNCQKLIQNQIKRNDKIIVYEGYNVMNVNF